MIHSNAGLPAPIAVPRLPLICVPVRVLGRPVQPSATLAEMLGEADEKHENKAVHQTLMIQ